MLLSKLHVNGKKSCIEFVLEVDRIALVDSISAQAFPRQGTPDSVLFLFGIEVASTTYVLHNRQF